MPDLCGQFEGPQRDTYTATDLEYTDATKDQFVLSLLATEQLQQNYQAIVQHEAARDLEPLHKTRCRNCRKDQP